MCVIAIAVEKRLTTDIITKCDGVNRDGIGVAWFRQNNEHYIDFKKGIKLEEAVELAKTLPLPYVFHFRLSTVGGYNPLLCHPFVATPESPLVQNGAAKSVLFHNGHWHDWHKTRNEFGIKLKGAESDSRVIASIVGTLGSKSLHLFNGKFALLSIDDKNTCLIERFGDWQEEDGVLYSNLIWKYRMDYHCENRYFGINQSSSCYSPPYLSQLKEHNTKNDDEWFAS